MLVKKKGVLHNIFHYYAQYLSLSIKRTEDHNQSKYDLSEESFIHAQLVAVVSQV